MAGEKQNTTKKKKSKDAAQKIEIPLHADLAYASELKKDIETLLVNNAKGSIEIDMSETERISLACIQVLIAARKKTAPGGRGFVFSASPAIETVLQELGLEDSLPLTVNNP